MSQLLWKPSQEYINASNMKKFMDYVNQKYNQQFKQYHELYEWSVENIPEFWETFWNFADIKAETTSDQVLDALNKMIGVKWFKGAKLNFAENLLRYKNENIALIFKGEGQKAKQITYLQLYNEVACIAQSLKDAGLCAGDRVVGFMPNMPETIIAMLAATSIGAIWSSCSPDFGVKGILDRFGQIQPKIVFTADGYFFKGQAYDSIQKIQDILKQMPSAEKVIVVPYIKKQPKLDKIPNAVTWSDFKSKKENLTIKFKQLPFDHPLYIMYSSGTTGLPKCMVQSAGGILLHQLKELILHTNLKQKDKIFYFTTCGWMMWNWLTCSLATGATIVLYDGSPFYPDPGILWEMVQKHKITVFGTSAGYIEALKKSGIKPKDHYDLASLKTILSTGSPLSVENFHFVYNNIKKNLQLSSISGGTDLNGCFALGNPMDPVYAGELQCRGLAMKVKAFNEKGTPVLNTQGELVCTAPFPSMPIYFWDDPDGKKYQKAYYDDYPGVWRHGDFITINDRGGVVIFGRSDATLNPGGVRIGTADIYQIVEQFQEIEDSIVIGQNWKNDVRIVLFVKMADKYELTDSLIKNLKKAIRDNASPKHVPAKILTVQDIPYTLNMKKVELAVKKVIHNQLVLNKDALRNPESLDFYKNRKELYEN